MLGENTGEYISLKKRESKCTGTEEIIVENLKALYMKTVHECSFKKGG